MLRKYVTNANKIWSKLLFKKPDGAVVNIELVDLHNDRFEEFIDFFMEYYVKKEISHQVSGVPKSAEAMAEYREYHSHHLKNNSKFNIVLCCEQNHSVKPKIVGFSAVKTIKLDEPDEDYSQVKTEEMKKLIEIVRRWGNLFPISDLMKRYNIDCYLDDKGLAVHPDYTRGGLATALVVTRRKICKAVGVPLTGAWVTALATAKAAQHKGYETVFEISFDELSKKIGVSFENPPPVTKYVVAKPWEEE